LIKEVKNKKVKNIFLIAASLFFYSCSNFKLEKKVFGVKLRAETPSQSTLDIITQKITQFEEVNRYAMDPDCLWRKKTNLTCENPYLNQTLKLEALADQYKTETVGYFDVLHHEKKDFAGMSQGFFLESLVNDSTAKWLVDFAGDIYFSGEFPLSKELTIADPLDERLTFSVVEFKSGGYMIAASSRALGAEMRNPNTKNNWQEDFQKIVLFSDKDFSGSRLDAWSTALIAGGVKLLDQLNNIDKYKNHWGYIYFNQNGEAFCSSNLKCQLSQLPRKITLPF
jgi:hypothetical protein